MDEQAQNPPTSGCLRAVFATAKARGESDQGRKTHTHSLLFVRNLSLSLFWQLTLSLSIWFWQNKVMMYNIVRSFQCNWNEFGPELSSFRKDAIQSFCDWNSWKSLFTNLLHWAEWVSEFNSQTQVLLIFKMHVIDLILNDSFVHVFFFFDLVFFPMKQQTSF